MNGSNVTKRKRPPTLPRTNPGRRNNIHHSGPCDLMILLPHRRQQSKQTNRLSIATISTGDPPPMTVLLPSLLDRLELLGYTHVALVHTVYGRPDPLCDDADMVIPEEWIRGEFNNRKDPSSGSGGNNKSQIKQRRLCILRRLHAIVENVSDVGVYVLGMNHAEVTTSSDSGLNRQQQEISTLLAKYDLVSLSPRNEATLEAVCISATASEIITLDCGPTISPLRAGPPFPFSIRSSHLRSAAERNAVVELLYSSSLLHRPVRRKWVQAAREVHMANAGVNIDILCSSGSRRFVVQDDSSSNNSSTAKISSSNVHDEDVGAMALRSPQDLVNLLTTVLRFPAKTSHRAIYRSGHNAIQRGRHRRFGFGVAAQIVGMYVEKSRLTNETTAIQGNSDQNRPSKEVKNQRGTKLRRGGSHISLEQKAKDSTLVEPVQQTKVSETAPSSNGDPYDDGNESNDDGFVPM